MGMVRLLCDSLARIRVVVAPLLMSDSQFRHVRLELERRCDSGLYLEEGKGVGVCATRAARTILFVKTQDILEIVIGLGQEVNRLHEMRLHTVEKWRGVSSRESRYSEDAEDAKWCERCRRRNEQNTSISS